MHHDQRPAHGQRGFTIVEALAAFLVLAAGLMALLSFHATAQRNNADARILAEATALAEWKLNELASFLSADDARLSPVTGGPCPGAGATGSGVAAFALDCDIDGANPRDVRVTVSWRDRDDNPRHAVVGSAIRLAEPDRDAAGLLALVRAAVTEKNAVPLWPTGATGDGAEPETGDAGPGGDSSDGGPGDGGDGSPHPDDPGAPEPLTLLTRTISGATVGGNQEDAPEILSVAAGSTPPSISAHCSRPSSTSFRCTVTYADPRAGWSGAIALAAPGNRRLRGGPPHATECGGTVTLFFTAVTRDIDDVSLSAC